MAESTQIRIDVNVKSDLENFRDESRVKTHSDAIHNLINYRIRLESEDKERRELSKIEMERRRKEDIHVGEDHKKDLIKLQDSLGLSNINDVVDLLLFHFDSSDTFSRDTLTHLVFLKDNR